VLTTVLNDLAAAAHDLWLVLDDDHLVDSREVGNGIAFLLEHLPRSMHVAISTRAAALQLAALSIQGRDDVAGFIARFAGNVRYIIDYCPPPPSGSGRCRRPSPSTAPQTFNQATASLHASSNLVEELSSTVVLADMWLAAGRPGKARRLGQTALQLAEVHGESAARATADLHAGLNEIECEAGYPGSARRHLEAASVFVRRNDGRGPLPLALPASRIQHLPAHRRLRPRPERRPYDPRSGYDPAARTTAGAPVRRR
jgi:hypothetical protein